MPSCLHFNCFILALHIVTFTFTACLVGGAGGETVEMEMIKYVLYDRNRKVVIKKLVDFTCFYYGKKGRKVSTCSIRKNENTIGKMIWVLKGTLPKSNLQGPKEIWVPKSKL